MTRVCERYTEIELGLLEACIREGLSHKAISAKFGYRRTDDSLRCAAARNGWKLRRSPRPFTDAELVEMSRRRRRGESIGAIAAKLGRPKASVGTKLAAMACSA